MDKNGTKVENYESDIVKSVVDTNDINRVGTIESKSIFNKYLSKVKRVKDGKGKYAVIGAIVAIIIVIVVAYLLLNNKESIIPDKKEDTIYEEAYKNMEFKENSKLQKLSCVKKTTGDDLEIEEEETRIYYFDGNDIDTAIYHNYVKLSDNYEDYFSTMYDQYKKSINNDYKYENVKTGLTDKKNELLVTIIIDNKSNKENKLSLPAFVNYEDAKKSTVDNGFICE